MSSILAYGKWKTQQNDDNNKEYILHAVLRPEALKINFEFQFFEMILTQTELLNFDMQGNGAIRGDH